VELNERAASNIFSANGGFAPSFLGIDAAVPQGYENLNYTVRIKGNGTKEQFAEIHQAVMATSPNFYNMSRPVTLKPALVVE
jgi:hypothetical protein